VAEAKRHGVEGRLLADGEDSGELSRDAASKGTKALGMAGGDGSLGAVASVALERDLPFVSIPFGTRNHFARDMGIDPDDPIEALAAFQGSERRVDVGTVTGRLFLNNVSLGLYAGFVHDPQRKTRNRFMAFLRMAPAALGRSRRALDVAFEVDGRREHHEALVVLVANNDYRIERMADIGERTSLEEGLLHAYVIEAVSRTSLLALLARAAVGNIEEAEGLAEWSAGRFSVESSHARVHAAIDGEPVVLETPLEFEVKPRALRVLVPPSGPQGGVE
jgi:diacylglycerol kinase family enzyme